MRRLVGKRVLVTGSAQGIGHAIVARFVSEGATVLAADIDQEKGEGAAVDAGARFIHLDVADERRWRDLRDDVLQEMDGLDILVNNAGIGDASVGRSPETTELDDWRAVFRVNAEGVMLGCREFIPVLAKSGRGSIINLSSIAALVPTPFITAYGASKAAVLQLSRSIAMHCALNGYKVRCNTIHPGQIKTPMHDALIADIAAAQGVSEDDVRKEFLSRIPLGEMGEADDIASAAVFLASDEAKHITGTQIIVDGGMTLTN